MSEESKEFGAMSNYLYDTMTFTAGEDSEVYKPGMVSIEIVERTCPNNGGIIIRAAFELDPENQVYEIGFNNREQLRVLYDALHNYFNR